jgi:hypothetical protein
LLSCPSASVLYPEWIETLDLFRAAPTKECSFQSKAKHGGFRQLIRIGRGSDKVARETRRVRLYVLKFSFRVRISGVGGFVELKQSCGANKRGQVIVSCPLWERANLSGNCLLHDDLSLQQRNFNTAVGCAAFLCLVVFDLLCFTKTQDEHSEQRNLMLL